MEAGGVIRAASGDLPDRCQREDDRLEDRVGDDLRIRNLAILGLEYGVVVETVPWCAVARMNTQSYCPRCRFVAVQGHNGIAALGFWRAVIARANPPLRPLETLSIVRSGALATTVTRLAATSTFPAVFENCCCIPLGKPPTGLFLCTAPLVLGKNAGMMGDGASVTRPAKRWLILGWIDNGDGDE
jgi:hypothetical protein